MRRSHRWRSHRKKRLPSPYFRNARTNDVLKLPRTGYLLAMDYGDPAIRTPLERFENAVRGRGLEKTDRLTAAKDMVASLRNACGTDIAQAQAHVKYDYFRRELEKQQQLRLQLSKGFDDLLKRRPM